MAEASQELVCNGFIETGSYESSKRDLLEALGISEREIDDRLESLIWALHRDPAATAERIGSRNLWVAVTAGGITPIRIYLRPATQQPDLAELLWIEERY
jgi:hypothetical protein